MFSFFNWLGLGWGCSPVHLVLTETHEFLEEGINCNSAENI